MFKAKRMIKAYYKCWFCGMDKPVRLVIANRKEYKCCDNCIEFARTWDVVKNK